MKICSLQHPGRAICAAITLSACTTMGTARSVSGGEPVTFSWKAPMAASAHDVRVAYRRADLLVRLSESRSRRQPGRRYPVGGWDRRLERLSGWGPFPEFGFATVYSGRVMANLTAADGQRMRCRFELTRPADGMAGGGQGQCQLQSGRSVDAVFPPA